jgi:putative peptidoglycan binding protein
MTPAVRAAAAGRRRVDGGSTAGPDFAHSAVMRAKILLLVAFLSSLVPATTAQPADTQAPVVNETLATQIMLDRIGFSPGEIDGRIGPNLKRALLAFQQANELPTSGRVDPASWDGLTKRANAQPPLVKYELVEADIAGPFIDSIPADLMEQSRLPALGYTSPIEALGEKFHSSPALLRKLNPAASFASAGEQIVVPNIAVPDPTAPVAGRRPTTTIEVSKDTSALTVHDEQGHVIFHAPVTSGSEHDPISTTTRLCSGTRIRRMPRRASHRGRTTLSERSGSICPRSTTGFTARRNRGKSGTHNRMAACG